MSKKMPTYTFVLYYLILALVLAGLTWAYFLPVEITVAGHGFVSFLGEPQAVSAPLEGTVDAVRIRGISAVKKGEALVSYRTAGDAMGGDMHGVTNDKSGAVTGAEMYGVTGAETDGETDGETAAAVLAAADVLAPAEGVPMWQRDLLKGDFIRAGERLALIYPQEPIGVKVYLPEKDLGRVKAGLPVRVSLDAYPYQNYGFIRGTVRDFVLESAGIPGQEMHLVLYISLEEIPGELSDIKPGLAVSVEIITGRTRLLKQILF